MKKGNSEVLRKFIEHVFLTGEMLWDKLAEMEDSIAKL